MSQRLLHVFPTFGIGGSQVRLVRIINHFGKRYRHTIYATDDVYDSARLIDPAIGFDRLDIKVDKRLGLRNVPRLCTAIRSTGADTVVTHNWGTIEWALAARLVGGPRHVHIEDGFGPDEAARQLPRRVLFRRIALAGRRTTVVVPSRLLQRIATGVWRLPTEKVLLVANGIDLARFSDAGRLAAQEALKKAPGELLIGTVATLRPEKNLALMIQAFARLQGGPPIRLFIVGDGPELPALQQAARDAGVADRVVFFGYTREPERIVPAFDIYAMSSVTEQMPISLLEAMACALPIATTDAGDIRDMIGDANKPFVTARGDAEALAASLQRLIGDASLRAKLGAENRVKVRALYDEGDMFRHYGDLFG